MAFFLFNLIFSFFVFSFAIKFKEQYRAPHSCAKNVESYIFNGKEYLLQNLAVNWENGEILCRGYHNGTLAIIDTKEKADFLAEALSESEMSMESLWVGARRAGADDPAGYRWGQGLELRRTAFDVLATDDRNSDKHYPLWLNRTQVPVPEGGADCVALERVSHDKPVFVDLPCHLERPFVCEKDARPESKVTELRTVRCKTGLYRVYDGKMDWHQAAAYCVINKMNLANIGTMRCLKKLGMTMLKTRPSMETAWVGARGTAGVWKWIDSGMSIYTPSPYYDDTPGIWPPMRDLASVKPNGCLQLDRHATHPPMFMEERCERKMPFICYQMAPALQTAALQPPSDDNYFYVLVRQALQWQHASDTCLELRGSLAVVDSPDVLLQLLLVMGESQDDPVDHIWVSGQLNMSKDATADTMTYTWYNPANKKKIPDQKTSDSSIYIPPWLEEEFSMDSPCLNLDRQDHLKGILYGLPCYTPQFFVCMIEKSARAVTAENVTMNLP